MLRNYFNLTPSIVNMIYEPVQFNVVENNYDWKLSC
jgi:hypothetical protein